ncbi:hypothetical protein ACB092_06G187500 [Castanea dentata]
MCDHVGGFVTISNICNAPSSPFPTSLPSFVSLGITTDGTLSLPTTLLDSSVLPGTKELLTSPTTFSSFASNDAADTTKSSWPISSLTSRPSLPSESTPAVDCWERRVWVSSLQGFFLQFSEAMQIVLIIHSTCISV